MTLEPNHIYQYSLLNALMSGVSSTGIPISTLLTKGNQGLGTFTLMNGELLLLDGVCYQLLAEGKIRIASPTDEVPFCAITNFRPEHTFPSITLASKPSIDSVLDSWASHSRNLFISYRITGFFKKMKCRTARGQEYEGQSLSELGKTQFVGVYERVRGTVIGFRSPEAWQGFSVAGQHMHFIDEGRKVGGHVLEFEGGEVEVQVAVVADVHVELPRGEKFNDVDMKTDDEGIKGVEG